jgi:hypothetical protein
MQPRQTVATAAVLLALSFLATSAAAADACETLPALRVRVERAGGRVYAAVPPVIADCVVGRASALLSELESEALVSKAAVGGKEVCFSGEKAGNSLSARLGGCATMAAALNRANGVIDRRPATGVLRMETAAEEVEEVERALAELVRAAVREVKVEDSEVEASAAVRDTVGGGGLELQSTERQNCPWGGCYYYCCILAYYYGSEPTSCYRSC